MRRSDLVFKPRGAGRFFPQLPRGSAALGVVIQGMRIGALVRLVDGTYVQMNGDMQAALNRNRVEAAMKAAGQAYLLRQPAPPVVVVVKRRRAVEQTHRQPG